MKTTFTFGSVCSGIEAASVAWRPLGWRAAWLSEIEPFPSAVLAHHYPDVPNLGDMTTLPERILSGEVEAPDLFCGGTPCQAFSVAGLRNSLDDARGNLSLTFVGIANAIDHVRSVRRDDPAIIFWENVPGVLSTKDNAFGCFLAALAGEDEPIIPSGEKWTNAGCVYGPQRAVAWRVLDAQYFGVAQRRRRVFVVTSARDDFNPATVLFEFDGVRRDTAPSREAGKTVAPTVTNGPPFRRTGNERVEAEAMVVQPYQVGNTLTARMAKGINSTLDEGQTPVLHAIPIDTMNHVGRGDKHSMGDFVPGAPGYTLTKGHSHAVAFYPTQDPIKEYLLDGSAYCMDSRGQPQAVVQPIPFDTTQITSPANYSKPQAGDPCHPLAAGAHAPAAAQPIGFDAYNNDVTGDVCKTIDTGQDYHHVPNVFIAQPTPINTMVAQPVAYSMITSNTGSNGLGVSREIAPTLDRAQPAAVAQPIALQDVRSVEKAQNGKGWNDDGTAYTVDTHATQGVAQPIAFNIAPGKGELKDDIHVTDARISKTIDASGSNPSMHQGGAAIVQTMQVRRLTPVECERLQGFPDNYTNIPWRKKPEAPDGPRYKALGNSWAVPVVRWIGERIQEVAK